MAHSQVEEHLRSPHFLDDLFFSDFYTSLYPMVLDPESASHLKPWLVRTLEPICDAEPGALADYILALLQHNVPENEMREELAAQLDEFLEKECSSFIDTLFTVIRTKSYMPYSSSPKPLDSGIPIPLDALLPSPSERLRKRSTTDDERDGRPPAKGPRLNNDGQFSRYGNGGDGRMGPQSSGGWGRPQVDRFGSGGMGMGMGGYPGQMVAMGMNGMNGMNGMGLMSGRRPQGYQPPDQKRGVCRDYHNNGYCARGATCKYSHGDDAVVPGQLFPGASMPFMSMFPGGPSGMPFIQGAAYDPHEARMDMRPMGGRHHQRAPLLPRIQQEDGSRVVHPINASGELPVIQDLTPIIPPDVSSTEPLPHGDVDMQQPNTQGPPMNLPHLGGGYNPMMANMNGGYQSNMGMDVDNSSAHIPGMRPPTLGRGQSQYRGGRGGGGRGRGTFGGEVHNFRPEKRNDKTLVVEKIPEDKLSLEGVNGWFKRFGTVTNVAIDASNAKALVSFSNHDEAHAAWKSEDAVFGNRFVKVFWHRPMEGHGQVGQRMLAASALIVANMASKSASPAPQQPTPGPTTTAPAVPSSTTTTATATAAPRKASAAPGASAIEEKRQLLEQTIAEQNALITSYSTAPPEEKKGIMARLRKIDEEMTALKTSIASSLPSASTSTSSSSTAGASASATAAAKKPVNPTTERERLERERLDKELEMSNGTGTGEQGGETTEDLNAQLEKLKAEAASLGINPSSSTSSRGYRGRGRGSSRGYYRGNPMRGGPPRSSMKLDNRPKKLLVKGVREDSSQALRDWYETTGQLESIEPSDGPGGTSYIVSFKSRPAAEAGLAKGANIPIVGSVQISWYTSKESQTTMTPTQTSKPLPSEPSAGAPAASHREYDHDAPRSPDAHSAHLQEEEIVASGWGGGDDEDGMGLL